MNTVTNRDWWTRARKARDELVYLVLTCPNVILVDIGQDPLSASSTPVLRVHIRPHGTIKTRVPEVVDDIPVRVIPGDYRFQ